MAGAPLGLGANFSQSSGIYYNYGGVERNLFIQDNWRVSRKLTFNLGIRWDPYFPYTDTENRIPCYRQEPRLAPPTSVKSRTPQIHEFFSSP